MKTLVVIAALASPARADDHTSMSPVRAEDHTASMSPARAEDPTAAITTQPLAVVGRGVSIGYERLVIPRFSVVALVGARATALGDYSSTTLTVGGEVRWWLRARPGRQLRSLYLAAHVSAGRTRLVDNTIDASVGSTIELTERVDVGWRFAVWRRLSLTPTLGVGGHEDYDGRGHMAPFYMPTAMLGLELGWYL
jgi:hypothetical protein